jgi:hypothetical protein
LSNLPDDGNQLVAEAIHDLSSWADKPFFYIDLPGAGRSQYPDQSYPSCTL